MFIYHIIMSQQTESSFYVTLTSSKTSEFPNNSPNHFKFRLPQALWLTRKWKVGLASLYLPGVLNPIPHVVTSHPISTTPTHVATPKQFSYKKLSNLYKGTSTDIMFQQYAKAFKSSQWREFL